MGGIFWDLLGFLGGSDFDLTFGVFLNNGGVSCDSYINMDIIVKVLKSIPQLVDTRLQYQERCYQILAAKLLEREGVDVSTENICEYSVAGIYMGYGRIDIVAKTKDELVIIELKANVSFQHKDKALAQTKRYLKHYKTKRKLSAVLAMYNVSGSAVNITKVQCCPPVSKPLSGNTVKT